ncbi:hypothetical protein RN001_013394 [Aquatica leii]|uniref:Uncharacterized protein n=1 Tax=Aquatica leii TaxID=1421715 RepID=A0AAN7SDV5_9COLE|nr:hypothetical protein RN001_013394 [Aquatica leii]
MPKYQTKLRQYRKEWEEQDWAKGWLQKFTDQSKSSKINGAYCKLCKSTLRAHIMDLKKHANSQIHKKNMEKYCMKNKLVQFGVSNVTKAKKICDLKLAIHIAIHSSVLTSDHLCETLREVGQDLTSYHTCSDDLDNNDDYIPSSRSTSESNSIDDEAEYREARITHAQNAEEIKN